MHLNSHNLFPVHIRFLTNFLNGSTKHYNQNPNNYYQCFDAKIGSELNMNIFEEGKNFAPLIMTTTVNSTTGGVFCSDMLRQFDKISCKFFEAPGHNLLTVPIDCA